MRKTYQSIQFQELHSTIIVGGRQVTCDFLGGTNYPHKSNGTYSTSDKEIQDALEASQRFNKSYRLLTIEGEQAEEGVKVILDAGLSAKLDKAEAKLKEQEIRISELMATIETMKLTGVPEPTEEPEEPKLIEGIENLQQARDYLVKEFGLKKESLRSPASILKQAREHNVKFDIDG